MKKIKRSKWDYTIVGLYLFLVFIFPLIAPLFGNRVCDKFMGIGLDVCHNFQHLLIYYFVMVVSIIILRFVGIMAFDLGYKEGSKSKKKSKH